MELLVLLLLLSHLHHLLILHVNLNLLPLLCAVNVLIKLLELLHLLESAAIQEAIDKHKQGANSEECERPLGSTKQASLHCFSLCRTLSVDHARLTAFVERVEHWSSILVYIVKRIYIGIRVAVSFVIENLHLAFIFLFVSLFLE